MRLLISGVLYFTCFKTLDCLNGSQRLNSRQNYFDIDLLRYATEDVRGNVVLSPASLKSILAMLLEGAEGLTATETRRALRLSSDKEDLRVQLNLYLTSLKANATGVLLENANAVFVSKKLHLKKDYVTMLQTVYLTDVARVDFSKPTEVVEAMNSWVNNKTRGLISIIMEPANINPTSDIFVTNAIFFKSSWHNAFDSKLTHGGCFYYQGVCQTVAMMEMEAKLNYAYIEDLMAHALELPYEGNRYSMILLVPVDRDGCSALIRDLPYMNLPQIYKLMQPFDVTLSMPKFTINYSEDMVGPLRNMRITSLFSATSNLSGIFEGDKPYVNSIFHKVYMSVDEAGTVASAATSAMIVPLIHNDDVVLTVDRPFVVFIRDNELGLVLFEGKIEEPTAYVETGSMNVQKEEPIPGKVTAHASYAIHTGNGTSQVGNETVQTSVGVGTAHDNNGKGQTSVGVGTSQVSNGKEPIINGKPQFSNETKQTAIRTAGSYSQNKEKLGFFSRIFG